MHIEPGLVNGVKIALSYATAAGAATYGIKLTLEALRQSGALNLAARALLATIATFVFFEILPHFPVGVSEVHFILGSTLFLIFGVAPAAFGLAAGLLIQGLFFAPIDLPHIFYEPHIAFGSFILLIVDCKSGDCAKNGLCRLELPPSTYALDQLSSRSCGLGCFLGVLRSGVWR